MENTTDEESGSNSTTSVKTYKCQLCAQQLMSMGELKTHLNKNHKGTDNCYPCTECSSIFKRRDHLGRHMMTQHQVNSQRVPCPFKDCDTVMTRKDHLRRHISQVHKVDPSEYLPSIKRRSSTTTTTTTANQISSPTDSTSTTTNPSSSPVGDHNTKFKCVFTGCDAELSRKDHLCRHIKNVHKADPRDVIGHLYKTPRPEDSSPSSTPAKSSSQKSSRKRKSGGDDSGGGTSSRKKKAEIPSIPSSSSGGAGALDLPHHHPPGHQAAHPSTLSDYDYGADYELDDFGDQQEDEHLQQNLQIIDEGDDEAALCIFCCYSFYPEEDEEDKLQESFEFNKFFSEVLEYPQGDERRRGGGEFRNFLEFFGGSLFSVCGDCWGMLIRAMGRKLEVEEVGMGMRALRIDKLKKSLGGYVEEMERIEGVISGADLEIYLKGKRRRGVKRQIYKAMVLRDTILEMTNKLEKWREEMENRLIEKVPLEKKDKRVDEDEELANDQLPTQVLSSSSSEESEQGDDNEEDEEDSEEEEDETSRRSPPRRTRPSLPEEPDFGSNLFECPFEDCYVKLTTKRRLILHVNSVHSQEPEPIRKIIIRSLKEQGFIPLAAGERNTILQNDHQSHNQVPEELLPQNAVQFEGVDISSWSCFKQTILLDCKKRKIRSARLQAQYSPTDIRDPRLEYQLKYNRTIDLFTVGDIPIIINEGDQTLGCGKCQFWTSTDEPPPPNPRRPFSNTKISWKSKEIESHIQLVHHIIYKCPFCPTTLINFRQYILHLLEHPNRLSCNYCHKPYFDRNVLRRHKWTRHLTQAEIEEALENGEKDPRLLPKENDVFRCATCGNSYTNGVALKLHEDEIHSENGKRGSWVCGDCENEYSTKGRLIYHQIIKCEGRRDGVGVGVGEDGRFECEICGSSLKSWGMLGTHVKRVHSKEGVEREWGCEICGEGFGSREGLIIHARTHSEERPFGCRKECGATFKRKSHVKRHEGMCKGFMRGKCGPKIRKKVGVVEGIRPEEYRRFDKVY